MSNSLLYSADDQSDASSNTNAVKEKASSLAIPLIELQEVTRTFTTGGGIEVHA